MKKSWIAVFCMAGVLSLAGCANQESQTERQTEEIAAELSSSENKQNELRNPKNKSEKAASAEELQADGESGSNILIAYFSRVGNTDFPEGIDAVSSASLMIKDGNLTGNTQHLAQLIQQNLGGDLFLIETVEKYPADYDETDEQGRLENHERTRPALAAKVENLEDYDTVFIGFPNWYYDMPMAVYTFLEETDLSGKTVIPFNTSGGSGFSNSIAEIRNLEPEAEVIADGFTVSHSRVKDVTAEDIAQWLSEIGF